MDTESDFSRLEVKEFLEWVLYRANPEDIPECPCITIAHQLLSEEKVEPFPKPCYTIALEVEPINERTLNTKQKDTGVGVVEEVLSPLFCPYGNGHEDILIWASDYVEANRRRIGLEEPWSIHVRVVCPLPTTNKKVGYEGKITWDSEVWYATIDLLCTLPGLLYEWVLVHELFELKHWRTGDAFQSLIGQMTLTRMRSLFARRFSEARNQEIELEVGRYLSARRPAHLMNEHEEESWKLVKLLRAWREEYTHEHDESDDEEENPYPDILTITKKNDEE